MNFTDNQSNRYNVRVYRNSETQVKEDVMADFILFLKREYDGDILEDEIKEIEAAAKEFIGFNLKKVQAGEKEMLESWIKAANT